MHSELQVYHYVHNLPWPSSFAGRLLFIIFIGIHLPLLAVILFLLISETTLDGTLPILFCAIGATFVAASITLWLIYNMVRPIKICAEKLDIYSNEGVVPDFPVHYTDEMGRLMANLQKNISRLDSLLRLKNKLLSILSHDARSPINSILMAQELIDDQLQTEHVNNDELQEYNDIIKLSLQQLRNLFEDTLTLARFDAREIEVHKEPINVQKLLQDIQKFNKLTLESKHLHFSHSSQPLWLAADEAKLKSILNNLVQNAVKFTPDKGTIDVKTTLGDQYFTIQVIDNGVGIDPEVQQQLFEPLQQSSRRGTQDEKGTGMGLWICKTFAELIDGYLSYETKADEGTTFTLAFDAERVCEQPSKCA